MESAAEGTGLIQQGWLGKQGRRKSWKKYLFLVYSNYGAFCYFESEKKYANLTPKGYGALQGVGFDA